MAFEIEIVANLIFYAGYITISQENVVYFQVEQAIKDDNCCFGTVDSWLLYKLTKGENGNKEKNRHRESREKN